ncbi:hypothetical protein MN608_01795 [Microdochium nivale]|nr:hypothetical protein MN608_01795 [Microdochium nivale]
MTFQLTDRVGPCIPDSFARSQTACVTGVGWWWSPPSSSTPLQAHRLNERPRDLQKFTAGVTCGASTHEVTILTTTSPSFLRLSGLSASAAKGLLFDLLYQP